MQTEKSFAFITFDVQQRRLWLLNLFNFDWMNERNTAYLRIQFFQIFEEEVLVVLMGTFL